MREITAMAEEGPKDVLILNRAERRAYQHAIRLGHAGPVRKGRAKRKAAKQARKVNRS